MSAYLKLFENVRPFLEATLAAEAVDVANYRPGVARVDFHRRFLDPEDKIFIEEAPEPLPEAQFVSYEDALLRRLQAQPEFNLLALVGGLGSGKSTTIRHVCRRLENDLITKRNQCSCGRAECARRPLIVDCIGIGSGSKKKLAIKAVFNKIRFDIYERLLTEWLQSAGISVDEALSIDPEFAVLRRLLITNDLLSWQNPTHQLHVELSAADTKLESDLLAMKPSLDLISKLVSTYSVATSALDSEVGALVNSLSKSRTFLRRLLAFYASRCDTTNPLNLLVVDNLDELPTATIERVLSELHDAAAEVRTVPMVVPLRPSSIATRGHVRNLFYRYHYGPDGFDLILHRLAISVLSRARSALISGSTSVWPAGYVPEEKEIRAFLFVCFLYSLVLASGKTPMKDPYVQLKEFVHKDHNYLFSILVDRDALLRLARTVRALVGTSARYAIDQAMRFISNCYARPTILQNALSRICGLNEDIETALRVRYGDLVHTVLAEAKLPVPVPRVSNLFLPVTKEQHPSLPSTVKIRILAILRQTPRMRIRTLVARLGLMGIPREVAVHALNSLHDKNRLLLWFSKNRRIDSTNSDLDQYVVVSEHGWEYFDNVLGDFEYVWYCACELNEKSPNPSRLNFPEKVAEYLRLVDDVGTIEWKQLIFHRCSDVAVPDYSDQINPEELFTLRVLYSTLTGAVESAQIALSLERTSREHHEELNELIAALCGRISTWEHRYVLAFGGTGFLLRYRDRIHKLETALSTLQTSGLLEPRVADVVVSRLESWAKDPVQLRRPFQWAGDSAPPQEDLVSLIAKYGRGIPQLDKFAANLDKVELVDIFLSNYLRNRNFLRDYLGSRLPTFRETYDRLRYLLINIEEVVSAGKAVAANSARALEFFIQEEANLRSIVDALGHSKYSIPEDGGSADFSVCKSKCNSIITLLWEVAIRHGLENPWHLSLRWQ